ncbi:hypothetical protein QR680_014551 [Steinernema hermaphroditum]|uniref:Fatty-acid and retinol-binding protein 1 n=1 Tax=Steinernema hermaphroditum TaxID=289476 RepID=A0AA39I997_9BILA|nr:hypothetical protein QR680_014551 [Steinernema hermaphroditum]
MFTLCAVTSLFCAFAFAAPTSTSATKFRWIPDNFIMLLPQEEIFLAPTPELKAHLNELRASKRSFLNDAEALEAMKETSPRLYRRFLGVKELLESNFNRLSAKGKQFFVDQMELLRRLGQGLKHSMDDKKLEAAIKGSYKALTELPREDLLVFGAKVLPTEREAVEKVKDYLKNVERHLNIYKNLSLFKDDEE